jgi:glycosyltransferase involved in cell wall biosynthesis
MLARPHVASAYYGVVKSVNADARLVYDTIDLHHLRARGEGEISGSRRLMLQAWLLERLELAIFRGVDAVLVLTDEEERYVRAHVPSCLCVKVPMIHDIHRTPGAAFRRGLLFVGNFGHQPNLDAMSWLTRDVLPQLEAARPHVEVDIVGSGLPKEFESTLPGNARYRGWIEDLAPVYERRRVALAPMRFGAGMKGKVTQALSFGLPVVTTPVGAEGLPRSPAIRVATSAAELVSEALALVDDDALWAESSRAALDVAARVCNRSDAEASLRRAFNR